MVIIGWSAVTNRTNPSDVLSTAVLDPRGVWVGTGSPTKVRNDHLSPFINRRHGAMGPKAWSVRCARTNSLACSRDAQTRLKGSGSFNHLSGAVFRLVVCAFCNTIENSTFLKLLRAPLQVQSDRPDLGGLSCVQHGHLAGLPRLAHYCWSAALKSNIDNSLLELSVVQQPFQSAGRSRQSTRRRICPTSSGERISMAARWILDLRNSSTEAGERTAPYLWSKWTLTCSQMQAS